MLAGFSTAPTKSEGGSVSFDDAQETFTSRYTHETIALAFSITEEAIEDNLYDRLAGRYTKALARSMAQTKQIKAAAVLNNAFTAGASAATGSVTTNDTDSDDSTSDLKVRGVGTGAEGSTLANKNVGSAISGTYGTFTLNQDGSYSYDVTGNAATIALAAGATATDTFSYKVRDDETNAGTKAIDIGTITFTITGINESPTATNDNITVSTTDGSTTTF